MADNYSLYCAVDIDAQKLLRETAAAVSLIFFLYS